MRPVTIITEKLVDLVQTRGDLWIIGYGRLIKECQLEELFDDPTSHLPRISIAHAAAAAASLRVMGVTVWFSEVERRWMHPGAKHSVAIEGDMFYIERMTPTP